MSFSRGRNAVWKRHSAKPIFSTGTSFHVGWGRLNTKAAAFEQLLPLQLGTRQVSIGRGISESPPTTSSPVVGPQNGSCPINWARLTCLPKGHNDADGRRHTLIDKAPIFSTELLDAHSKYPQPGTARCTAMRVWHDPLGRELITISTADPFSIESIEGLSEFSSASAHSSQT